MTQPTSKSEEAAAFLLSVLRERGCIDKADARRIFTEEFRDWGERTAAVRFMKLCAAWRRMGKYIRTARKYVSLTRRSRN
jgi:hypothetical protein